MKLQSRLALMVPNDPMPVHVAIVDSDETTVAVLSATENSTAHSGLVQFAQSAVNCMNACDGIGDDLLEGFSHGFLAGYPDRVLQERRVLEKTIASLVAAASEVMTHVVGELPRTGYLRDTDQSRAAIHALREALAKAQPTDETRHKGK